MQPFADRLLGAIDDKRSCVCVGIDPVYAKLPDEVTGPKPEHPVPRQAIDAFYTFIVGVLDAVAEHAAAVKFQSAYFEQYHAEGVEAYFALVAEAKERGLMVLGDVKRGDIGSTSEAYAAGHLAPHPLENADGNIGGGGAPGGSGGGGGGGEAATPDAITVNPMLGPDTLEPFLATAAEHRKGLFVLVRTSNPGSTAFQDVPLADGRTWSQALADVVNDLSGRAGLLGEQGYSGVGAVVGATQPQVMQQMRRRMPRSIFLLPGYGTQGATGEMTRHAFDDAGRGAIVSASRSVLYPQRQADQDWKQAIAAAARAMRDDLRNVLRS